MECRKCGFNHNDIVKFCIECGEPLPFEETDFSSDDYANSMDYIGMEEHKNRGSEQMHSYSPFSPVACYNSLPSGNDPMILPIAKEGWNWGAFTFSWIWLLCHNMVPWGIGLLLLSYIAGPLAFIPQIYLGMKGNELAWSNRPFRNLQHFEETEKVWNRIGFIFFVAPMAFFVILVIYFIFLARY